MPDFQQMWVNIVSIPNGIIKGVLRKP